MHGPDDELEIDLVSDRNRVAAEIPGVLTCLCMSHAHNWAEPPKCHTSKPFEAKGLQGPQTTRVNISEEAGTSQREICEKIVDQISWTFTD
jgi:hypothetical protein